MAEPKHEEPTETHGPIEIPYTIRDSTGYRDELIGQLREKVPWKVIEVKIIEPEVNKDGTPTEKITGMHTLRVLEERKSPLLWIHIHIKLCEEGEGKGGATTTLAVRADNLYIKGFKNGKGKWFELWEPDDTEADRLPMQKGEYTGWAQGAEKLEGWGVMYRNILRLSDKGQVEKILTSTWLGRAFAERAVRRLSRYPDLGEDQGDDMPTRLGLAGLILLVCEAARMEGLFEKIASNWNAKGTILPADMAARIWEWKNTSASLLNWLDRARLRWNRRCVIENPDEALKFFYLLLNAKKVKGSGRRALVEILNVSADFHIRRITVVNEDDNDKPIVKPITIYSTDGPGDVNKEHQMSSLVLKNALKMGISGYKGFDIIVKSQASGGGPDDSIKMKWDCRKNDQGSTELVTRTIVLEKPKRTMEFKYLVMSDAIEVKVEVMVKLYNKVGQKDNDNNKNNNQKQNTMENLTDGAKKPGIEGSGSNNYTAGGTITARIDGYDHQIMLFSHEEAPVALTVPVKLEQMSLPIRSDVPVRRGKPLHIDMKEGPGGSGRSSSYGLM